MSTYTLLEVVQDVHNDLNLDLVNSIADTNHSVRVALMAKSVYFELISRRDWPHLRTLTELDSASSLTEKTTLRLPENTSRLEWVTYNRLDTVSGRDKRWALKYQYPEVFVCRANGLNTDAAYVESAISGGVSFYIRNDKQPTYWTSFNDREIVLDSFESDIETTVQGNKTQALIYKLPEWVHGDGFTPDLPPEVFPAYLAELKSVAALRINEVQDAKAEQQSVRQQRRLSNQAWRAEGGIRRPNYGRVPRGSYTSQRSPIFGRDS